MMHALLMLTLVVSQPSAKPQKAVVLPVRVGTASDAMLTSLAGAVERNLTASLMRHASFHVVSRAELAAMMNNVAQQQLTGCDADSCLVEIAEALDADFLVSTQMDLADGIWSLQSSLIDRKTTNAKRYGVRARDSAGLLASVDLIARQLAGQPVIRLDDPQLAERLQTNAGGVKALVRQAEGTKDADLSRTWTDTIVAHNRDSDALALVEGGLTLASGLSAVFLLAPPLAAYLVAYSWMVYLSGLTSDFDYDAYKYHFKASYPYPVALMGMLSFLPMPGLLVSAGALLAAAGVGLFDALDVGIIPVGKDGCCRDDGRLRDAAKPGRGRTVAPFLAAVGSAGALGSVLAMFAIMMAASSLGSLALVGIASVFKPEWFGPSVQAAPRQWMLLHQVFAMSTGVYVIGASLIGLGALGSAILLMANQYSAVVGRE